MNISLTSRSARRALAGPGDRPAPRPRRLRRRRRARRATRATPAAAAEVVIGGQNYAEMQIMSEMYAALLEDAGYDVTLKLVKSRDVYAPEMQKGNVDVSADYLSSMTEFLNKQAERPRRRAGRLQRPRRDGRGADEARRADRHRAARARRGAGRQRVRGDPGVRRGERPHDDERPRRARQAGDPGRGRGLLAARRLRARSRGGLRPRHHQGGAARLRHGRHQGRAEERRGRPSARSAPPTRPWRASAWCCSRTTRSCRTPRTSCRW